MISSNTTGPAVGHRDNYVDRAISQIGLEGVLPTMDRLSIHIRNPVTVFAERRSQFFCRRRRVDT
jgi:hypothetical protein